MTNGQYLMMKQFAEARWLGLKRLGKLKVGVFFDNYT